MHHTTRELRLAAALVEAADTLSDDFGIEEYLRRLADHCVDLLAAQAAGIMLIDGGRTVSLTGSSAHEDMALDLLQAQHSGGPCLDTYGSGRAVPPVSIRAAARPPAGRSSPSGRCATTTSRPSRCPCGTAIGCSARSTSSCHPARGAVVRLGAADGPAPRRFRVPRAPEQHAGLLPQPVRAVEDQPGRRLRGERAVDRDRWRRRA
ncbi:hypothetical protein QF037_005826 [Streptomyces canus]|uniref:hypothetical protein n=1 Tax=Streptomyces canus TaxID=58343 RepID=UPI00278448F3|nr:hypothetical protein [Streptomyces canus]MDQ0601481.1 hypothetical protein [Streptomyces canus]